MSPLKTRKDWIKKRDMRRKKARLFKLLTRRKNMVWYIG